jgi:hypothetical protein
MSGAKILEFGTASELRNLDFSNLEQRLERYLETIKSLPDLENMLHILNPLPKAPQYNEEQKAKLKRFRQRAYDRKRHAKFPNLEEATSHSQALLQPEAISRKPTQTFIEGIVRTMLSIDGERFIKTVPKSLAWLIASLLSAYFVWQQSLALYRSAGFDNAIYAAAGGIFMIVGFAAYHSITRSWLALLFCLYAGAYEAYLMVSGTVKDEQETQFHQANSDVELGFLAEKANKERARYHELKQRYDEPESKVYKNEWFLKHHLNPAWDANSKAHEEFTVKKAAIISATGTEHVTWLKIFYRLGLVFLCMMLVHRFFAMCNNSRL